MKLTEQMHNSIMEVVAEVCEEYGIKDFSDPDGGQWEIFNYILDSYRFAAICFDDPHTMSIQSDITCAIEKYEPGSVFNPD